VDELKSPTIAEVNAGVRPALTRGVIVFLHGWTGDEHSMDVLDGALPAGWWRFSLRAPFGAPGGGFSWSDPTVDHGTTTAALRPGADALARWLSSTPELNGAPFVLMGFSQGAAVALACATRLVTPPAGLAILAGFAPGDLSLAPFAGMPIYWSHGLQDRLVPIDRARRDIEALRLAGAPVVFCEADVGHKVGVECVRGLKQWLEDLVM
jgi:phospholipase/carboxylesterase